MAIGFGIFIMIIGLFLIYANTDLRETPTIWLGTLGYLIILLGLGVCCSVFF